MRNRNIWDSFKESRILFFYVSIRQLVTYYDSKKAGEYDNEKLL